MKYLLTRHGQKQKIATNYDNIQNNAGLTEKGIGQIIQLGETLRKEFPALINQDKLFCSYLPRSVQSAEILRNILTIKQIQVENNLAEFYGTTKYSLPENEKEELNKYAVLHPDFIPEDVGKSLNQALDLFEATLRKIASEYPSEYVLIAGHSMVSRYFIYKYAPELTPTSDQICRTRLNAGSYSVMNFDGKTFKLEKFNMLSTN